MFLSMYRNETLRHIILVYNKETFNLGLQTASQEVSRFLQPCAASAVRVNAPAVLLS